MPQNVRQNRSPKASEKPGVHNNPLGQLLPDAWKEQYQRVKRWHARIMDLKKKLESSVNYNLSDADFDFIWAFFHNAYHLRDWIDKSVPNMYGCLQELFSKPELKICRDLCNASKHLIIKSHSLDENLGIGRTYDHLSDARKENPIGYSFWAITGGDKIQVDIFELCSKIISIWDCFIEIKHLS